MIYYSPIPDISRYQYPVNPQIMWDAGVRLVIIRCTVGDYYTDTRFVEHWDMFKDAGFLVGVYHVNTPEYSVSSQMARLFGPLGLNGRIPDVPIVLDCELTRGQSKSVITANIIGCLADIEDLDERVPIVYTRASWWNPNVNPSNLFEKYPLMVARYSNAATHPWNDNPLTLKPHSFTDWALWQWSADGNWKGAEYGVGSAHIDLNRGNAETLAGTLALLNKTPVPPPPDSIGEPAMQFITKYAINVRSGPNTTYSDIGDLPAGYVLTALEIQATDNNSVWVRFDTEKWVALVHNGGGPYLNYHPAPPPAPVPVLLMQTVTNANLRWFKETNAQGKPIMSMPPADLRPKFLTGSVIACKPGKIDCDGTVDYYEVMNGEHATPKTYTPPAGYTGWFVSELDVFEVG